jgi:hypothetical protein
MKTVLKFIIGLTLLIIVGFIIEYYFPVWLGKMLAGIGFCWMIYDFWIWVNKKLA